MKLKMVGLGKMGFNLALNMKDHEVDVCLLYTSAYLSYPDRYDIVCGSDA